MVSIFAKTVFTDTQTVSLSDGVDVDVELNNEYTPPGFVDISSLLGGFAYIETLKMAFEFDPPLQYRGLDPFNENDFEVIARPFARFDGDLDLFTEIPQQTIFREFSGTVETTAGGERDFTIDTYVDTPLEIKYGVTITGGGTTPDVEGNQTLDVIASISMIGRQP